MIWALAVVLGLGALCLLLLAARVTLVVDLRRVEELSARARLIALYGWVDKELGGRERPGLPKPKKAKEKKKKRKKKRRGGSVRILSALASEAFMSTLARYLRRLKNAVKVGDLRARLRVGLDDPAETGRAWGLVGPLHGLAQRYFPELELTPSFEGACLEIDAHARVALVPLEVIGVTLAFFLSPAALRVAWAALVRG